MTMMSALVNRNIVLVTIADDNDVRGIAWKFFTFPLTFTFTFTLTLTVTLYFTLLYILLLLSLILALLLYSNFHFYFHMNVHLNFHCQEHGLKNLRTIHRLDRLTSGLLMFGRWEQKLLWFVSNGTSQVIANIKLHWLSNRQCLCIAIDHIAWPLHLKHCQRHNGPRYCLFNSSYLSS